MNFASSDFALIRWNVLVLCAAALISAAFLYASGEYAAQTLKDRRDAQAQLNKARSQLTATQEDRENMAAYAGEYVILNEYRILGDGQRLDWMEGLERLRRQQLVASFRYNISPQKPHEATPPINSGNFDVFYSEMSLELDLLHEGQLLKFLIALHDQVKGHYQLEACTLQRLAPAQEAEGAPQLKATCRGGWITLKNRDATP